MGIAVLLGGASVELVEEVGHDVGPGAQLGGVLAQGAARKVAAGICSSTIARQPAIRAGVPAGRSG